MNIKPETVSRIGKAAGQIAEFCQVKPVDIAFVREFEQNILRVTLDKEGGVTTADCEAFSRAFSKKMDELDLIKEHYFLEVCSPGTSDYQGVPNLGNKKGV